MTAGFWIELAILLLGFGAAALLFWRFPCLPERAHVQGARVSVVIPARNEAKTLPLLLADLADQSFAPLEIFVANDASEDETAAVARSFGATVLDLYGKPADWIGKSWACQQGALRARGDLLLFLDADVRLRQDALERIVSAFQSHGTVSVHPWHAAQKPYEQLSMFFDLIQIGANGSAMPKPVHQGLFGPVVAISLENYARCGGHESVKSDIVEDMALAGSLRRAKIPFSAFVGDQGVSFRMYPAGFCSLWQGFAKNIAFGASKTPAWSFLLVALLLASASSAALHFLLALARGEAVAALYGALYACWSVYLALLSRRIGRFHVGTSLLYPLPLALFLLVFLHSGILRLLRLNVVWKGRAVKPGR